MPKRIALEKAVAFALRIVKLYKYLAEEKKEFVLSKQMLISGYFYSQACKGCDCCGESEYLWFGDVQRHADGVRYRTLVISASRRWMA